VTGNAGAVVVADVNGDGKPDLALIAGGTAAVLLGNGDGTFQPPATYYSTGTAGGPDCLAVADVNGDGKPDLIVGNAGESHYIPGSVGVLLGNGDGTFQPVVEYAAGTVVSVSVADINGDGKPDLLLSESQGGSGGSIIGLLLGNGDGSFQPFSVVYELGGISNPGPAVPADLNGDGKLDIVAILSCNGDPSCSQVSVFLGNGDGTFQSPVPHNTGGYVPVSVAVADVNGDGKPDLLVVNPCVSNGVCIPVTVGVLLGNGDGTFHTAVTYDLGGNTPSSIAVADLNGDGLPDLLVTSNCIDSACQSGAAEVLVGNADGTFQPAVLYDSGGYDIGYGSSGAIADVNGDGKPDLLVTNSCVSMSLCPTGEVSVLLNTSTSGTSTALTSSPNPSTPGQAVTFTATVTALQGFTTGTPSGTVSFLDGTTNLGNATLGSSLMATLTNSTLSGGLTHSITATYNGDTKFGASTSPVVSQVVQGAAVTLSPGGLDFSNQTLGVTAPAQSVTITNTGNIDLTISSIQIAGTNAVEFADTTSCGSSLTAGASCTVSVKFTPTTLVNASAALSVADNAPGSPQIVTLTGTVSLTTVSLSPSTVTFPSQYVGTTGLPQTVIVSNTGGYALTITNVTPSPADFGVTNNCTNTVQPGANCTINAFFDPTASGTRTGVLTITDNATGSPQSVTLTGAGSDFSIAPSTASSATISPGGTATYTLSIAPGGGFNQTVALSCSGAPAGSTCSLSSSSVALNGITPTSVTVTVKTAGSSAKFLYPADPPSAGSRLAVWLAFPGLLAVVVICGSTRRARHNQRCHARVIQALALFCLLSAAITFSSCGGGSSTTGGGGGGGGTTPGTYNVMVTGTFSSGGTTLNHVTQLTLVVQ
jgi:hypothetical protein